MFEGGSTTASAADEAALASLAVDARIENRAACRKVLAAGQIWQTWLDRDLTLGRDVMHCGNNALAEIAVRLGVSKTMAENFATVGVDLRDRLPLVRAAFAAGDLDYPRVARISRATTGFRADTVRAAEAAIVAAARMFSPGPLAAEIDIILIRLAPDEVAERRETAAEFRRIRTRTTGDLTRLEADLAPDEAAAAWQRVCEVADTVCRHDKRNRQYRLVDAFMALMHGEASLRCLCGRPECSAAQQTPPRRKPLVQVSIDIATLLGLLANPAYLHGYGPIDPALARELAADGTWQAMLTETLDLARSLGLVDTADVEAEDNRADDAADFHTDELDHTDTNGSVDVHIHDTVGINADESDNRSAGSPTTEPDDVHTATPDGAPSPRPFRTNVFHARGHRRYPAALLPCAAWRPTTLGPVLGTATLSTWLAHADTPDIPVDNDPTDSALRYRPDAATSAIVRARDRHCRFPHCRMPAAHCQLDHVVPFDHHAPRDGGRTMASNLQCLCAFHHGLKTMALWTATMLPGAAVRWTSSTGRAHVTLPGGGHTATPVDPALVPTITGGPQAWRPPEPTPTDEPPPF